MWREHAARRAVLIVALVVIAACVAWAALAQTLAPPACTLPTPPANNGYLTCPTPTPT